MGGAAVHVQLQDQVHHLGALVNDNPVAGMLAKSVPGSRCALEVLPMPRRYDSACTSPQGAGPCQCATLGPAAPGTQWWGPWRRRRLR